MRIVVAVDWSEDAFDAVKAVTQLYRPQELVLVHAVDLRPFESPLFAPAMAKQVYDAFRGTMLDGGQQLLAQTSELVPAGVPSVKRVCEIGSPAEVILNAAQSVRPDLVVVGARGRSRLGELVLGSVSHRVLLHAPYSTLIVKRPLNTFRRALLAVEGADDITSLRLWLQTHPFEKAVDLSVISVVPSLHMADPTFVPSFSSWEEAAYKSAGEITRSLASDLNGSHYTATNEVLKGDPATVIARKSGAYDLVVVGSLGRKAVQRFLLGSVSHAITHSVSCPVLVAREGYASS